MQADQSVDNANRFITLSTPRKEYLLGQPVVLEVLVMNLAQGELVISESFPGGIEPEIAPNSPILLGDSYSSDRNALTASHPRQPAFFPRPGIKIVHDLLLFRAWVHDMLRNHAACR